jgi:DNA/RNA endonuclease YhcR with UshA esterase domain
MKKLVLIVAVAFFSCALGTAQSTKPDDVKMLKADEAKDAIGKTATITGKVAEVHIQEKVTHINFDRLYPNHPFSAVVFSTKTNLFPDLKQLLGKKLAVSGKVEEFKGKPQIVLQSTNQLKIVETDAGAKGDKSETPKSDK